MRIHQHISALQIVAITDAILLTLSSWFLMSYVQRALRDASVAESHLQRIISFLTEAQEFSQTLNGHRRSPPAPCYNSKAWAFRSTWTFSVPATLH